MAQVRVSETDSGMEAMAEKDLWSKLPEDVVETILRRLCVYDIVRAKYTCKRFRTLISREKFVSGLSKGRPNLLLRSGHLDNLYGQGSERAYDPCLDSWIKLSLDFLQPHMPSFVYRLASSEGLLCFGSGHDFIVCNPITKSWTKLPQLPYEISTKTGRSVDVKFGEDTFQAFGFYCVSSSSSWYYELIILNHFYMGGESGECWPIFYSSNQSKWSIGEEAFNVIQSCKLAAPSLIACGSGVYYSLWKQGSEFVVHGMRDSTWIETDPPECNNSPLLSAHLMDRHGALHMVGGVGTVWLGENLPAAHGCEADLLFTEGHMFQRPTSFRIWKLDSDSKLWSEVTRMPSQILHEFQQFINFDHLSCWGKDDVLYMKSHQSDVLMYDFTTKNWRWLEDLVDDGERGVIFEPSLAAKV